MEGEVKGIYQMGSVSSKLMQLQNIACPAQHQLTHIPWLPVVD